MPTIRACSRQHRYQAIGRSRIRGYPAGSWSACKTEQPSKSHQSSRPQSQVLFQSLVLNLIMSWSLTVGMLSTRSSSANCMRQPSECTSLKRCTRHLLSYCSVHWRVEGRTGIPAGMTTSCPVRLCYNSVIQSLVLFN